MNRELHKDSEGEVRIIDNKLLSKITENAVSTQKFLHYDATVALVNKKVFQIIEEDKNPETSLITLQREIKKS